MTRHLSIVGRKQTPLKRCLPPSRRLTRAGGPKGTAPTGDEGDKPTGPAGGSASGFGHAGHADDVGGIQCAHPRPVRLPPRAAVVRVPKGMLEGLPGNVMMSASGVFPG